MPHRAADAESASRNPIFDNAIFTSSPFQACFVALAYGIGEMPSSR
jgi:hypothetical protein